MFSGSEHLLFLCFSSKLLGVCVCVYILYTYIFFYYIFQYLLHVWSVLRLCNVERMLKNPFHMWAGCQFYGRDLFLSYRLKLNPTCDGVQFFSFWFFFLWELAFATRGQYRSTNCSVVQYHCSDWTLIRIKAFYLFYLWSVIAQWSCTYVEFVKNHFAIVTGSSIYLHPHR